MPNKGQLLKFDKAFVSGLKSLSEIDKNDIIDFRFKITQVDITIVAGGKQTVVVNGLVVKTKDKIKSEKFDAFLKLFNTMTKRSFAGTSRSITNFHNRLNDGFTGDQFKIAIKNAMASEIHINNNYANLTPEYITREDQFNKWVNVKPKTTKQTLNTTF